MNKVLTNQGNSKQLLSYIYIAIQGKPINKGYGRYSSKSEHTAHFKKTRIYMDKIVSAVEIMSAQRGAKSIKNSIKGIISPVYATQNRE